MSSLTEVSPPEQHVRLIASANVSDVEASHRGHAQAVDRIRSLEGQLDSAFEALHVARAGLQERAGVDAVCRFSDPMKAAWDAWIGPKTTEGMKARPLPGQSDQAREDEALAVANAGAKPRRSEA